MKYRLRILPLLITAMFASCSPVESEQMSKNAVSEYKEIKLDQIDWPDCLKQEEDHYLVFFYSDTCPHCHEIIGDVIEFSLSDIAKLYFLNTKETSVKVPISNDIDLTIGVETIDDLFIMGTPTIIEVEEWSVKANVAGKDNCLTFLNEQRLINKT